MRALVLTLFPEMFPGPLGLSLAGKALAAGLWELQVLNPRDFATDRHQTVDDKPYGGGTGMVMRADVLGRALDHARNVLPQAQMIYLSPRGEALKQKRVQALSAQDVILLCGRFEGVDQRIIEHYQMLELSLGDFVLSGGELAAMSLLDAAVRLLPGVIGNTCALAEESFGAEENYAGLLEYPHYTRPPLWNEMSVPETLISGNHERIRAWRREQAERITQMRRQDLWTAYKAKKDEGEKG